MTLATQAIEHQMPLLPQAMRAAAAHSAEKVCRQKSKADTARRFAELLEQRDSARRERDELRQASAAAESEIRTKIAQERFDRQSALWRKVYPDFDQVLTASLVPDFIVPELLKLDNSVDISYLIAKNSRLCSELADLRPHAAIKKLQAIAGIVEEKTVVALAQIRRGGF